MDAPYYLAIYSDQEEGCERNAGYLMEQMVLYMTAKGLGTCYLGSVQPAQKVRGGKRCLMMVAFGYPEGKLYRESPLAKRLPLNELCIFKEEAGEQMKTILRAARLAPSAMNTQPWRFIVYSDRIYVFALKPAFRARASMRCANSASASCSPTLCSPPKNYGWNFRRRRRNILRLKVTKWRLCGDVDAALDALIHCIKC